MPIDPTPHADEVMSPTAHPEFPEPAPRDGHHKTPGHLPPAADLPIEAENRAADLEAKPDAPVPRGQ